MWTICLEQQYHVGKLKYHVSVFTTCGWVLQPSWNGYLFLWVERSRWCVDGRKVRAKNVPFYLYDFLFSCHMILRLTPIHETSDLFHDTWRGHPPCSSCGRCHCHTGSLPFIVSTWTPEITSLQVASPTVTQKHTVTIHTWVCAMFRFMLSAVKTASKKPKWRRTAVCPNIAMCCFIIFPGQQLCHTG